MTNRRNNLLILSLVAVLLALAVYFIFLREPVTQATRLGLDLRGGVTATLEGTQERGQVTRDEMEQAASIIRQRVDRLGVAEPEVLVQGEDQVVVNIPGVTDERKTIELIGSTAQLGFYRVLAGESAQGVSRGEVESAKDELRSELQDDPAFEEGETKVLFQEQPSLTGRGTDVEGYVVPEDPNLTGAILRPEGATVSFGQAGDREVSLRLTREGGEKFGDLTAEISSEGLAGEPGQLAIALDEQVQSAPVVEQAIYGGQVVINNPGTPGGLPEQEAENLVTVLNTGALPVNMEVLSVTTIGPTLGTDSLKSGLIAALVGFALVLLFLLFIYRVLGVVASVALLIYAFLLWGLIVAIPITVTLPGIAGVVLSIGVAADANIVIFERIKEEVRRGKTPRTAIAFGYQRGFRAILDGNVTTLITAFILFALSTGSVRGFAVLLALGVLLSMFTAVVVTRALLGFVSGYGLRVSPAMMGISKKSMAEAS
jgi:preprotein translocase subunit SecD